MDEDVESNDTNDTDEDMDIGKRAQAQPEKKKTPNGIRFSGKVAWFNAVKGFGFITRDESQGGGAYYVHRQDINIEEGKFKSLKNEEVVEFNVIQRDGQERAVSVTGPNGAYCIGQPKPKKPEKPKVTQPQKKKKPKAKRYRGKVKWFNGLRGFGWIARDEKDGGNLLSFS